MSFLQFASTYTYIHDTVKPLKLICTEREIQCQNKYGVGLHSAKKQINGQMGLNDTMNSYTGVRLHRFHCNISKHTKRNLTE